MALEDLIRDQQQRAVSDNGAGGKGEQSMPILAVLGIKDAKTGTLGALSSNGIMTKEVDVAGLFRETWLSKMIKGGFDGRGQGGGGGGGGSDISAPQSWTARTSGGGGGGMEVG